jgi:SAM-dependent methyltransferase
VTCAGSTPDWEQHYWYWPNAGYSGVTVSIDVTSSTYHSDPFHFEFFEKKNGRAQKLSDVWIPNDLRFFLNFTSDRAAVDRVQRGMDASSIVLPGYMAFRYCEDVLRRNGIDPSSRISLLDWGCGVGRVTAHFLRGWPRADVHGIDIDLENVRWCEANLARGHFAAAPLWPPTHYRDGAFDAVVGISVMTHLAANAQAAWLAELARIVRPGGLALLTFSGTSGSAAGSRWCSQEWWDAWKARGFDDETRDPALAGHIDDDDYYRQTSQSAEYVRSHWSKDFEIVDIVQAAFGNQDLAVLRRR